MKQGFLPASSALFACLLVLTGGLPTAAQIGTYPPPPGPGLSNYPTVVTLSAPDPWATEPGPFLPNIDPPEIVDPAVLRIHRHGGTNIALPVYYSVMGVASNGVDFVRLPGIATIPAGATSVDLVIEPLPDNLAESVESVYVAIQPIACIAIYPPPPDCYGVGFPRAATAYIRDATTSVNQPPIAHITNPQDGAAFTLGQPIPVTVVTTDNDGYAPHVILLADGVKVDEQTIYFFQAPPDGEPIEFNLVWNAAPRGPHILTAIAIDDEGARGSSEPVLVLVESGAELPEIDVYATDPNAAEPDPVPDGSLMPVRLDIGTFTVSRTGSTEFPLIVYVHAGGTAANGIDYSRLPWSITIPAGEKDTTVEVAPIDDSLPEGTETVVLSVVPPPYLDPTAGTTSSPNGVWIPSSPYRVGPHGKDTVFIHDNEPIENLPPRVQIVSPASGAVFLAPATIDIFAHAFDADGYVVQVEFFEGNRSLGVTTNNPLALGAINPFHVTWKDAAPGTYTLSAVATDDDGASTRSLPVYIKVVESQPPTNLPPVVSIKAVDPIGSENAVFGGSSQIVFRIARHGPTNQHLTVHYQVGGTAVNGEDYDMIPLAVTIPAGAYGAHVVIRPIDDQIVEPLETIVLSLLLPPALEPATSSNTATLPPYLIGIPGRAAAILIDNDGPRPPCLRLADGLFHLCRPAADGFCYRIEVSTDLVYWEPILDNTVTDGAIHFVDPDGTWLKSRFYRIIPIPCPVP